MTVKLEKDMLESVDSHCEGLGCSRTDFIVEAVQEKLEGKTGNLEINYEDIEPENKPVVKGIVTRVSYDDGKTWHDVKPIPELRNVTVES